MTNHPGIYIYIYISLTGSMYAHNTHKASSVLAFNNRKPWFVVFTDFCGVNFPFMAYFKLPTGVIDPYFGKDGHNSFRKVDLSFSYHMIYQTRPKRLAN